MPNVLETFAKSNQRPEAFMYTTASANGLPLQREEFYKMSSSTPRDDSMSGSDRYPPMESRVFGQHIVFDKNAKIESRSFFYDSRKMLINYGFFFRMNFSFRAAVSEYLHGFFMSQKKRFPTDGDCIAIHIRRGDRIPRGDQVVPGENARDWCRKHTRFDNGTCLNQDTNEIINDEMYCWHFDDYGCHGPNPYGGLVAKDFLDASRIINNVSKNIFIVTDASDTIQGELQNVTDERNIFILPTPHFHRVKSTANGIAYLAAIELVSMCTAFVGHSDSAVTMFMMRVMCARHAGMYGKGCPPFYDFNYSDRRRTRKLYQHAHLSNVII